jgi:hypothetical protein
MTEDGPRAPERTPDERHAGARRLQVLSVLLPGLVLGTLVASWIVAYEPISPGRWLWAVDSLVGVAAGLVIAFFVVTLLRSHERPAWRTAISCGGVLLLAAICVVMFEVDKFTAVGLFDQRKPAPLANALQDAADDAAFVAAEFLESGRSGDLPAGSWTSFAGDTVDFGFQWRRNAAGIVAIASPRGAVPSGEDGTPRRTQALPNGMIGVPLDYYVRRLDRTQKANFMSDIVEPFYRSADSFCRGVLGPIVDWAKDHGGELPDETSAAGLLAKVPRQYSASIRLPDGDGADGSGGAATPEGAPGSGDGDRRSPDVMLSIERSTYAKTSHDGIFQVVVQCRIESTLTDGGPRSIDGAITLTGTAGGLMGIGRDASGDLDGPFRQAERLLETAKAPASSERRAAPPGTEGRTSPGPTAPATAK